MASHKAQAAVALWMMLTMTSLTSLTLANNDNRCNVQNQSSKTIILSTTYYNSIYTLYNGEQINVFTNDGTHTPFQNVVLTPGNDGDSSPHKSTATESSPLLQNHWTWALQGSHSTGETFSPHLLDATIT